MPAFGDTHDDRTIWDIAAFVKAMPTMPESEYAAYEAEHGKSEGGHEHAEGMPPHVD